MAILPRMTRRTVLKGASALAGVAGFPYVAPASALGRDGRPAPSDRVTVGKLGCGGRGGGIGAVGGEIVAAYDPWKPRRQRYARSGAKVYDDFRDLLADEHIDAVAIASTDHWHVPLTIAAARAGKDMYTEKPLGVSIAQDLAARQAVRRYGRMFQYGTQQRSSAHCRFGCELVRNGFIGEVRELLVVAPDSTPGGSWQAQPVPADLDYEMWLGPAPWRPYMGQAGGGNDWWHTYDYAIGFIAGWGAHPLDILVWGYDTHLAGTWEVEGTGFIDPQGRHDVVCRWDVRLRFSNGVRMTFRPGGDYTQFTGTRGWVGISRGGLKADPPSLLKETIGPSMVHLQESRSHGGNFAEAVRTRRDPVSNIEDAVHSDLISHVSDIAVRLGRKVVWDPAAERFVGDAEANRRMTRAMRQPWRL
jgi:predicted dehydrogenase